MEEAMLVSGWSVAAAMAFYCGAIQSRLWKSEMKALELRSILYYTSVTDDVAGPSGMENTVAERNCPFPNCGKPIERSTFCCREHWSQTTEADRNYIWRVWNDYKSRKITAKRLREIHAEVVAKYTTALVGTDDRKRLEKLALLVEVFLAKDAQFRKCPEQMADEYKKLGREHRQIRTQLENMAAEILHPTHHQPVLFENPPEPPTTRLPD